MAEPIGNAKLFKVEPDDLTFLGFVEKFLGHFTEQLGIPKHVVHGAVTHCSFPMMVDDKQL